ncbi:MAG: hypothetical protein ACXAD7_26685 [Candidatus Kariarchaeaceae archaeon]|jgi:hypothetical protein
MTIRKLLLLLLLNVILLPTVNANIAPSQEGLNFVENSLTTTFVDQDLDGMNDEFLISVAIQSNNNIKGHINCHIERADNNNWLFEDTYEFDLVSGNNFYSISVPGEVVFSFNMQGNIRIHLNLYTPNPLDPNSYDWIDVISAEATINSMQFTTPPVYISSISGIQFLDTDDNGKFDLIEVTVQVVSQTDSFTDIYVNLHKRHTDWDEWIDGGGKGEDISEGTHTFSVYLGTVGLYDHNVNGDVMLEISGHTSPHEFQDYELARHFLFQSMNYLDFDPPRVQVIDNSMEVQFVDTDENGLFNSLIVTVDLQVTETVTVNIWVNIDQQENWEHIAHGHTHDQLSPGFQEVSIRVSSAGFYLKEYTGNISINLHGDMYMGENEHQRTRIKDQYMDNIFIKHTDFDEPPVFVDQDSILIEKMFADNSDSEQYDFLRINFDVIATKSAAIDFWFDAHDEHRNSWFAGSGIYDEIAIGKTSIQIDINGRDLYSSGYEGVALFTLGGRVNISNEVEYDYPEIEIRQPFSYDDFNSEGDSPYNEDPHDGENNDSESAPGLDLPILSILSIGLYLSGLMIVYHYRRKIRV